MTKKEIISAIEDLKLNIKSTEEEISDFESQIENLKYDLKCDELYLKNMKGQLEDYQRELLKLQTPQEQQSYWISFIRNNYNPKLDGQFERNNKWYVCNGIVLLESNNKLDYLNVCEGIDDLSEHFNKDKQEISFDINSYTNEDLDEDIKISDNLTVDGTYLLSIKNILQLDNNSKFYTLIGLSTEILLCENENGRAIILGKRN